MRLQSLVTAFALIAGCLLATPARAQNGLSSLSGVVEDINGGVLPGVTVVVKNDQTAAKLETVSNEKGVFAVPSIDVGNYTVTLSLSGFKTAIVKVVVIAAQPASMTVKMEVGGIEETVQVNAANELVQSQSTTVSSTLASESLKQLPFITRNLMDSVAITMVGVDAAGGASGTNRSATINGLPQNSVALTMDGVDIRQVQGEGQGSGFYAFIFPTVDATEQVTVTAATQEADSSGYGSASVRFVTKSGTNKYSGSAFEYYRNPSLNSNYFFNALNGLPKNPLTLHQVGASVGGPIQLPGVLKGRDKAFFFFDLEEVYNPVSATLTRQLIGPLAQQGVFRYNTAGGVSSVNLFDLARANGQTSTANASTAGLLAELMNLAAGDTAGAVTQNTDPNTQQFVYFSSGNNFVTLPTFRLDFNLPHGLKFSSTYHYLKFDRFMGNGASPPIIPGLPNYGRYYSYRNSGSETLRQSLGKTAVNEVSYGWQSQDTYLGGRRGDPGATPDAFTDQGGFALTLPLGASAATASNSNSLRHAPLWSVQDRFTWQHGTHGLSFGGSFDRQSVHLIAQPLVAGATFGVQTTVDPADAMFTTANFPGASSTDLTNARALYGYLTGRVTSITANAALGPDGTYSYLGPTIDSFHVSDFGFFMQDQWRLSSTMTLNYGLRYQVQLPATTDAANYARATFADLCGVSGTGAGPLGRGCNLFMPGTLTGQLPQYTLFAPGSTQYNVDGNNWAPTIGLAWKPDVKSGFGRALLGDPEQATVRASFGVSYNHTVLNTFLNVFQANPGRTLSATRSAANGNLVLPGQGWPVLYSDASRLGAPATCSGALTAACYLATASYPIGATTANNLSVFDPNLQMPYSRQFSIGLQRTLSKDMALEIRYVGTRNFGEILTENWNEATIVENGFLNEFRLAQTNLGANIAAGRGQTFAYFGPGTGTSPLPILLASFNGVNAASAGDASKYTGTNWTNTTYVGFLNPLNPSPSTFVSSSTGLYGSLTLRQNGVNAGLPVNFWLLNPSVASDSFVTNRLNSSYDGLQLELRRRLSHGLLITASYAKATQHINQFDSIHRPFAWALDPNRVPQSFKLSGSYDIPVGKDHKYGANMSTWLDDVIGGWNVSATGHVQSGVNLTLTGVRLVGMTQADLQQAFKIRIDYDAKKVYDLPQDIIDNTIKAFSSNASGYTLGAPTGRYIAPASGPNCVEVYPGDCGEPRQISVAGPPNARLDLSFKKKISLTHSKAVTIQYDLLNAFNAINFNPVLQASSNQTINQVTSAANDPVNTFDPGGRLGQFVVRFTW